MTTSRAPYSSYAGLLPAQLKYGARDVVIRQAVQIVNAPAAVDVGYGFNIKNEEVQGKAWFSSTQKRRWSDSDHRDRR